MTERINFSDGRLKNIFDKNDLISKFVFVLVSIAHDIRFAHFGIQSSSESERGQQIHFFILALSHLREAAKFLSYRKEEEIKVFIKNLDTKIQEAYTRLASNLENFLPGSLTKDTLKPLRDIFFHYPDIKEENDYFSIVSSLPDLQILSLESDNSILKHEYSFISESRNKLINRYINSESVSILSRLSVDFVLVADGMMAFLLEQDRG